MIVFPSSSTIRDFPVPEEFTMLACCAYTFSWTRYTEIVSRSTCAALPINGVFQDSTVTIEASVNMSDSDSGTTSYQDQTAYNHRRMEQIWSMQVVGFLDENRSGERVHGEDTQRTLTETANFRERLL